MNILGLSVFDDSSATIVRNSEIICAVEEERLNRIKHFSGVPYLAVDECLNLSGMDFGDIDYIAIGWNPYLGWGTRIANSIKHAILDGASAGSKMKRGGSYLKGCLDIIKLKNYFKSKYSGRKIPPIKYVNHHLAHASSAFYTSPFEESKIIVADGVGESETISFYETKNGRIIKIDSIFYPVSLGHLYAAITGFLGFKMTYDEGKTMALASYGEDRYREIFENTFSVKGRRKYFDISAIDYHSARSGIFSKKWLQVTGMEPRKKNERFEKCHFDLACSLQSHVERSILYLLGNYFPGSEGEPLCSAGGFFLNSVINGKIIDEFTDKYYVFPAAGDNGVSTGAALYINSKFGKAGKKKITNAYFGRDYPDEEIYSNLKETGLEIKKSDEVYKETAEILKSGLITGWYSGRMEFGPRALGNRSILADPGFEWMKDRINSKVKHREEFRPFAAAVLLEEAEEYFEKVVESPYMLKVFQIKDKYKHTFPAICHIDGSCRVQTVSEENNPVFYRLLKEIKNKSGYGLILNTSMNDVGEPIINKPSEAVNLFRKTELDVMVMGKYILKKPQ